MGKYAVVNPANGETVKEYPQISDEDLSAAITAAEAAHRNWALKASVSERASLVKRVAELHSELLKQTVLRDFADLWPEKFCNVTNGVTPRRFMALSNPALTELITEHVGECWLKDLTRLRG